MVSLYYIQTMYNIINNGYRMLVLGKEKVKQPRRTYLV